MMTSDDQAIHERAAALCRRYETEACSRTDRQFAVLMLLQWLAGIAVALWISPRTWAGPNSQVHPHLFAALFLGAATNLGPALLAVLKPGKQLTRHLIAVGQALSSALLIHLTGGRIEAHFHIFGSLAFLSFYRDWRVLVSASLVIALDHFVRGTYWPISIYGLSIVSPWQSLEHTGWVLFEDIFLVRSILQIQQAQQVAALHEAQVQAASHAKSSFLATMSHELRTPLNGILGMNELLLRTELTTQQLQFVMASRSSGKLLLQLISNVLDISKIESGKLELELQECSLAALVYDVVEALGPGATQKGLTLQAHVDPEASDTVLCDGNRIRQILINLIGNAIKFTATGTITVNAICVRREDRRLRVRFAVSDSGIGIPEDRRDRLFSPFTQGDSSTTRKFGGTGLGLAICKQLVELMDGSIGIESQIGVGSTFWFELPLSVIGDSHESPEMRRQSPTLAAAAVGLKPPVSAPTTLTGHVLVAEDNRINQMYVAELLKHCGCTCDVANNGDEVLEAMQHQRYDLVLMDCQMPEMDGFTASREIRRRFATQELPHPTPIIALTANALTGDRERCLEAGMDDYLTKPLGIHQLRSKLEQYLSTISS